MVTFNRSQIMKSAWNLVRSAGKTISDALKAAWAIAKTPARKTRTLTFAEYKEDTDALFGGMDVTTVDDFLIAMKGLGNRIVELTSEKCVIYA